jgi:endoglucanase
MTQGKELMCICYESAEMHCRRHHPPATLPLPAPPLPLSPPSCPCPPQLGVATEDHQFWGRPEQQTQGLNPPSREVYLVSSAKPGADIAGSAAAALAAGAVLFRASDSVYSAMLAKKAKQLFAFAQAVPGLWRGVPWAEMMYPSSSYTDDLAWAAAWLCR